MDYKFSYRWISGRLEKFKIFMLAGISSGMVKKSGGEHLFVLGGTWRRAKNKNHPIEHSFYFHRDLTH